MDLAHRDPAPLVVTKQPDDICQENRRGPGAAAGVRPKDVANVFYEYEDWSFCVCLFVLVCSSRMPCTRPEHPQLPAQLFSQWAGRGRSLQSNLDSALGHEHHSFAWQVFARTLAQGRCSPRVAGSKVDAEDSAAGMCCCLPPAAAHCFCSVERQRAKSLSEFFWPVVV